MHSGWIDHRSSSSSSSSPIYGYSLHPHYEYGLIVPPIPPPPRIPYHGVRSKSYQPVYDNVKYAAPSTPLLAYSSPSRHHPSYHPHYHHHPSLSIRSSRHSPLDGRVNDARLQSYFYERRDDAEVNLPSPDYSPPLSSSQRSITPVSSGHRLRLSIPSHDEPLTEYRSKSYRAPSPPPISTRDDYEKSLLTSLKSHPPPLPPRPPSKDRINRYAKGDHAGASRVDKPSRPLAPVAPSTSSMPFSSAAPPAVRPPMPGGVSPFNASGITVAYPTTTTITRETPKSSGGTLLFGMKKKNDKKKKIRKEDISNPTNFQHKAHVGWDQDTGFSNNADPDPMDATIKDILKAAGQDPSQMSKKTIKFVYDFIEKYQEAPEGQIANAGSAYLHNQSWGSTSSRPSPSISSPLPPPPPSRITSHTPTTGPPSRPPPPPPSSSRPLPFRPQDGPPLPPSIHSSPSAPSPPPPPPPSSLPPIAT
ncbi:hypothetical protein PMAYCL1PPCAC_17707, partial [Pristionchus mayeri]